MSPSNEYLGMISLRIDWFDILAVQGILKSLLQHHISKASIYRLGRSIAFGRVNVFNELVKLILFNIKYQKGSGEQ